MGYWNHAGEYVSELLGSECVDAYFYDTLRRPRRPRAPPLVDFLQELLIGLQSTNDRNVRQQSSERARSQAEQQEGTPLIGATTPPRAVRPASPLWPSLGSTTWLVCGVRRFRD